MRKNIPHLIALLIISTLLCGCQKAPEKDAVTSKNDGVFQEKINETKPSQSEQLETEPSTISWSEQFTSTDGSVNFNIHIDEGISSNAQQVIEVAPHRLTEEDIQRVAHVLLGDVQFYERRSSSNPQYSKSQYQTMINRLSAYATKDSLVKLMGESDADIYLEYVQSTIDFWTKQYENAPDEDQRIPCDWTLKKERQYNDSDIEIGDRSIADDSDVLYANAEKDGIEYNFSVSTRDGNDFKVNTINLNLTEGLGLYPVDMAIYRSMLCRTGKPTEDQINAVTDKATDMLEQMELGQWKIALTTVETTPVGDTTEYTIHITAAPVLNGVPALFSQRAGNSQDEYGPTYAMTYAEFVFSANGDIIYFDLASPLDIMETKNNNVATLSTSELMEKCKQQLSYSDSGTYGLTQDIISEIENSVGEKLLCHVDISGVEYSLGRVRVPNSDDHYYYIPVMALHGVVTYTTEQSGALYYTNYDSPENEVPTLISINAVDGSIIP